MAGRRRSPPPRKARDSDDRPFRCPIVGQRAGDLLQCRDGLLIASQAEQYQPHVIPGAGQCRSLGAGRAQAVSRGIQAVGDVGRSRTIRGVACGGNEGPQGVGAAPGAVTEQAQELQGYDVARDSLLNAVGDPFGLSEISLLIQGTEELKQCVDHRESPVRVPAR